MQRIPGAVADASRITAGPTELRRDGDTIAAYLARPSQPGHYPGIIVIHEAFGLVEHIRDLTRRFANLGYIALAPDLYSRVGSPDPSDLAQVFPKMFGLADAEVVKDLEAAAARLRAEPGATGKVGCIGFCSGGRQALLFACSSKTVDAAVDCWGGFISRATSDQATTPQRPTPVIELAEHLACPLLAVFGEEDQNPSLAEADALGQRLARAGKDATISRYAKAGHAFLADYRPSYREEPAFALWAEVPAFLDKHLRA